MIFELTDCLCDIDASSQEEMLCLVVIVCISFVLELSFRRLFCLSGLAPAFVTAAVAGCKGTS